MSPRVVAVTGAAGFVGGAVCLALARRGMEVRALVRDPARGGVAGASTTVRCDLPDHVEPGALDGVDAVVHCAYPTRETDPARAKQANEDGMRVLLDLARRAGVGRVVFVSTILAAPDAPSYYARSKYLLEQLLDPARDAVVRPGLVVGRGGRGLFNQLVDSMRRLRVVPLFGGGRQPLHAVHVDDVGEAVARILERDLTGVFNVADPDPIPFREFLRMMADRLGIRCVFVPLPFGPTLAAVRAVEALRLPFPLRSENLLGLQAFRHVPVRDDLARLDMRVLTGAESLERVLAAAANGRATRSSTDER